MGPEVRHVGGLVNEGPRWVCILLARATDPRIAQHILGHANLGTTDTYLGRPRIDDMLAAVQKATYGVQTNVLGVAQIAQIAFKATTGIEPV